MKDQATEMKLGSLLPSNWEDMRNVNAPLWTEQTITRIKSDRSLRRAKEKADEEERARERANEEERAREEAIKEDRERNRAREEFEKAGRKRRAEEEAIQLDGERRRAEKRVEKAGRGKRAMEEAEKTAREKRAKEEAEKAKAKATQQLKDELRPIDTELTLQTDIGESKCAEYNKILSRRFVWRRKKKLRKLDEELREVVQEVNRLLEARKSKNDELLRAHALAISTTETGVGIIAFGAMTTVSRIQRLLT